MGIAVRATAPKPDIGTVEKFKQTLLAANSFARNEGADSGIFMVGLLQRLGIFDAMQAKSTLIRQGHVAELVARGEVEMAAQQMSELMDAPRRPKKQRRRSFAGYLAFALGAPFCAGGR